MTPQSGFGSAVKAILAELGVPVHGGCQCEYVANLWDSYDLETIKSKKQIIKKYLRQQRQKLSVKQSVEIAWRALKLGITLSPLDPEESIYQEALRRVMPQNHSH